MEKQYKVIALSLGNGANKIFESGDIVDQTMFFSEDVAALMKSNIDGGFIEEYNETPVEEEKPNGNGKPKK